MAKTLIGFTVLYRVIRPEGPAWMPYSDDIVPHEIKDQVRYCKSATASAWIWYGCRPIADWMLKHPEGKEDQIPAAAIKKARAQLEAWAMFYQEAQVEITEMLTSLVPPSTAMEKGEPKKKTRKP
jgi:hypothetical protein